jgi:hypothetical protein
MYREMAQHTIAVVGWQNLVQNMLVQTNEGTDSAYVSLLLERSNERSYNNK